MKNTINIFLVISSIFLLTACTPKLTIQALQASKVEGIKVNSIFLEQFSNDSVYQTQAIANEISNNFVENKKVFSLQNNLNFSDAVLKGEVVNSSADYNVYYQEEVDFGRCRYFSYDKHSKTRHCVEYYVRYIPCEDASFNVSTNINLIRTNSGETIFSNTYSRSSRDHQCFYGYYSYSPFPNHISARNNANIVNQDLARQIAKDIIRDISPSYIYFDIEIIDDLKDIQEKFTYTKEQKEEFKKAVKMLENRNLESAKDIFATLDKETQGQSIESVYNLALIFEAQNELEIANKLYLEAFKRVENSNYKALIEQGIFRTNSNLEHKIKAISQLP